MSKEFKQNVELKYQLFNSLFLTLPYGGIRETGTYLPLLTARCVKGFDEGKNPKQIVDDFFKEYLNDISERERVDMLFHFVQYIERQVVLFDSIEDAAFSSVHDLHGQGTISDLFSRAKIKGKLPELKTKLVDFALRIVLTAHPTQFYPGTVLGIINDLNLAIQQNEVSEINDLLLQLGKTPFLKKTKPSPYDEAVNLIWFLENVFYSSFSDVLEKIKTELGEDAADLNLDNVVQMGFWPGGDRDGNPFVDANITRKVAARLKRTIQILYYRDVRLLKRKLTFPGVHEQVTKVEKILYEGINDANSGYANQADLMKDLDEIERLLIDEHQGLFLNHLQTFKTKVGLFGLHLASIDVRQDSSEIETLYGFLSSHWSAEEQAIWKGNSPEEKINLLATKTKLVAEISPENKISKDTLDSITLMEEIQKTNGEKAAHRYIISNSQAAIHVYMIFYLAKNLRSNMNLDVVPLFETIDDLRQAPHEMEILYADPVYRAHLKARGDVQTIMLGFSDGTKDGGYLSANWNIFTAKEDLTSMSKKYDIKVVFFDGRGGPPARGGGKSHKFYASLGQHIENKQVQLTIQGQTISSNFGTPTTAQYNIEQLLTAGLENHLFSNEMTQLSADDRHLINELAELSLDRYIEFKNHPKFLSYLEEMGTLSYYGKTNIGSRPVKRSGDSKLTLSKLRAIPFVGSWSQMKQNVPGYFGFGSALAQLEKDGKLEDVKHLYDRSQFFQTLVGNSMQSLSKCYFPLTAYLKNHKEYGEIWNLIHEEYKTTKRLLLYLSGEKALLDSEPDTKRSIALREHLVLPLLTIQQYALQRVRVATEENDEATLNIFNKMVMRTMFGIINAGRNSA